MGITKTSLFAAFLAGGSLWPMTACAQTAEPTSDQGLDDIVVTAQKQKENIQSVPIAVTAINGETLRERNVTDAASLIALVPNTGFDNSVGETRIAIRGITFNDIYAQSAEARVPFHLDGVYLSRSGNIDGTFFDVERIEVLRGPQGTLFGRNAIAGAVNLITKSPTRDFEGYLQADAGNYNSIMIEGAVSGPISNTLSFRIAGRTRDHSGYGKNIFNGDPFDDLHDRAVRAKIAFEPNSDFKLVVSADYWRRSDNSGLAISGYLVPPTTFPPGTVLIGSNLRHINDDSDPTTKLEFYGFGAEADWTIGKNLTLTSITSWRHGRETFNVDNDFSPSLLLSPSQYGDTARQFTQEIRLTKTFDRGSLMIGGYYFSENYRSGNHASINTVLFGFPNFLSDGLRYGGQAKTTAYAAFAQATYDITDALHLTVGGRYSHDEKERVGAYSAAFFGTPANAALNCEQPCGRNLIPASALISDASNSWGNFSPRVTLDYDITPVQHIYATYSKGFKSGGFTLGLDASLSGYNPETLADYEIGYKGDFFDRRLRVNVAGFYYDYKNLQVQVVVQGGLSTQTQNAAKARVYGFEAELTAKPAENLLINLSGSLMKSEFTSFSTIDPARPQLGLLNLSGNRLPSAPSYTASYGIQYTIPTALGGFTPRVEGFSQSRIYYSQFNLNQVSAPVQTIANAYINWESDNKKIYASVYIKNIANIFRVAGGFVNPAVTGNTIMTSFIAPRTFGGKIGVRF